MTNNNHKLGDLAIWAREAYDQAKVKDEQNRAAAEQEKAAAKRQHQEDSRNRFLALLGGLWEEAIGEKPEPEPEDLVFDGSKWYWRIVPGQPALSITVAQTEFPRRDPVLRIHGFNPSETGQRYIRSLADLGLFLELIDQYQAEQAERDREQEEEVARKAEAEQRRQEQLQEYEERRAAIEATEPTLPEPRVIYLDRHGLEGIHFEPRESTLVLRPFTTAVSRLAEFELNQESAKKLHKLLQDQATGLAQLYAVGEVRCRYTERILVHDEALWWLLPPTGDSNDHDYAIVGQAVRQTVIEHRAHLSHAINEWLFFRQAVSDWRHALRELDEQYDIDPPIPF